MLTRVTTGGALLILSAWLESRPLPAQTPSTVSVRSELLVPKYRNRFPDRRAIEAKVATIFAEYLTQNVGYLQFVANDTTQPYRLTFQLDRINRSATTNFVDIGFWVRLDRPGGSPVESYWLPLRTADQSPVNIGTEVDFFTEIKSKLSHQDAESLRSGVLRWVPIAETGLPSLNPLGFVLPFRLPDICMKEQSVVQWTTQITQPMAMEMLYKAQVTGPFAPPGPPQDSLFVGRGFARVIDVTPTDPISSAISQKKLTVKKVFVISYVHDPSECQNRTPRSVGGGAP